MLAQLLFSLGVRKTSRTQESRSLNGSKNWEKVLSYEVDVGDRDALRKCLQAVSRDVGNIYILVNNAGYTNPVPLPQVEFDDFEKTISVNRYGTFTTVQELLHLGNKFKLIVNIASTAGITGRSGWLTYSASGRGLQSST